MFPHDTKILLVDDSETIRKLVKGKMTDMGFRHFFEAVNGQKALEVLNEQIKTGVEIGLVICDINMPRMSGLELLKAVRAEKKWANLPFVILTLDTQKEKILEAMALKCSEYIAKPFTDQLFQDKLNTTWTKHGKVFFNKVF